MFYIIDFFTQYKFQDWELIGFNLTDFNNTRNNPRAYLPNGDICDILVNDYNIWDKRATIKTRNYYIYTTNLNYIYAEPTGE